VSSELFFTLSETPRCLDGILIHVSPTIKKCLSTLETVFGLWTNDQSTPAAFCVETRLCEVLEKVSRKCRREDDTNPNESKQEKEHFFSVRKKLEVLTDAVEKGKSYITVAKDFGICRSSVGKL
jgi:hypothetical protein